MYLLVEKFSLLSSSVLNRSSIIFRYHIKLLLQQFFCLTSICRETHIRIRHSVLFQPLSLQQDFNYFAPWRVCKLVCIHSIGRIGSQEQIKLGPCDDQIWSIAAVLGDDVRVRMPPERKSLLRRKDCYVTAIIEFAAITIVALQPLFPPFFCHFAYWCGVNNQAGQSLLSK